jgi:phage shock protein PspC (stress-responsive transcriptional regulator)
VSHATGQASFAYCPLMSLNFFLRQRFLGFFFTHLHDFFFPSLLIYFQDRSSEQHMLVGVILGLGEGLDDGISLGTLLLLLLLLVPTVTSPAPPSVVFTYPSSET